MFYNTLREKQTRDLQYQINNKSIDASYIEIAEKEE